MVKKRKKKPTFKNEIDEKIMKDIEELIKDKIRDQHADK